MSDILHNPQGNEKTCASKCAKTEHYKSRMLVYIPLLSMSSRWLLLKKAEYSEYSCFREWLLSYYYRLKACRQIDFGRGWIASCIYRGFPYVRNLLLNDFYDLSACFTPSGSENWTILWIVYTTHGSSFYLYKLFLDDYSDPGAYSENLSAVIAFQNNLLAHHCTAVSCAIGGLLEFSDMLAIF